MRWEPVDDETASLIVPLTGPGVTAPPAAATGSQEDRFTVRFDPQTGLIRSFEVLRYKDADSPAKILWLNQALEWGYLPGGQALIATVGSATWEDEGSPWAVFRIEEVIYNVDVAEYIRGRGL